MRLYRLAMYLAVVGLTMSLGYSTPQAQALPSLACAVGLNVHPGARILLNHHTIAQCTAGGAGCKCVSCYNLNGSVSALCFPLVMPNSVRRALILAMIIGRSTVAKMPLEAYCVERML